MTAHSYSQLPRDQEVLCELLHSLSQPLTSLRCSLELSVGEAAEQQQQTVATALEQTETVIGMIQLMREYLEAEQAGGEIPAVPLMTVLQSVTEELSSVAAVRDVRLRVVGTCTATMRLAESRLRTALEYLIMAIIERQPARGEVELVVSEGPPGAVLRGLGERGFDNAEATRSPTGGPEWCPENPQPRDSARATMRRVRRAIAARVLEAGGAALAFDDGAPGFVLSIPRLSGTAA